MNANKNNETKSTHDVTLQKPFVDKDTNKVYHCDNSYTVPHELYERMKKARVL